MIDYKEAHCAVPPLHSHPYYDEESDTWDVHFLDKDDGERIEVALETLEEAQVLIRKSVELFYNEKSTEED